MENVLILLELNLRKKIEENNEINHIDGFQLDIGGVILFDETIRQSSKDGTSIPELISLSGAVPGIKVDKGEKDKEIQMKQLLLA